jgi:ADP-ribose pyrophosphatase
MIKRLKIVRKNLLPKGAHKVFTGVIFDVYQWQQKMLDGSKQTFEMIKRSDTVVTIPITPSKKIIIEEQEQPHRGKFYSFPGGRIDDIKNIDLEALRELQEETGYVPKKLKFWKAFQPTSKIDWFVHFFIAQDCEKKTQAHPDKGGEKIEVLEINFDELISRYKEDTVHMRLRGMDEDLLKAFYDNEYRQKLYTLFFT